MDFKEKYNDGGCEYYIDEKQVSQEEYNMLKSEFDLTSKYDKSIRAITLEVMDLFKYCKNKDFVMKSIDSIIIDIIDTSYFSGYQKGCLDMIDMAEEINGE